MTEVLSRSVGHSITNNMYKPTAKVRPFDSEQEKGSE